MARPGKGGGGTQELPALRAQGTAYWLCWPQGPPPCPGRLSSQHSAMSKWGATPPPLTQVKADALPTAHLGVRGVCHSCDKDGGPGRIGVKAAATSLP